MAKGSQLLRTSGHQVAMITTKLASQESELHGIQRLQSKNLRKYLSDAEAADQGFLIAEYSVDYLRQMNRHRPSVIAVDGDRVVGYVLTATQSIREGHPLLADLFRQIDQLRYNHEPLRDADYVVVGQVCVDKDYRGLGLVPQMYRRFRESLQDSYRYAVTDIARTHPRSLLAHSKVGFQVIHSINFDGLEWDVVLWDWTAGNSGGSKASCGFPGVESQPSSRGLAGLASAR